MKRKPKVGEIWRRKFGKKRTPILITKIIDHEMVVYDVVNYLNLSTMHVQRVALKCIRYDYEYVMGNLHLAQYLKNIILCKNVKMTWEFVK